MLIGESISENRDASVRWWRIICTSSVPSTSPLVQRYTTVVVYDSRQHYFEEEDDFSRVQTICADEALSMAIDTLHIGADETLRPRTDSIGVQTHERLPFWDARGDLTWSVVGDTREVASWIINKAAGSYVEAVLGHDGTRRLVRFPNFEIDAEWLNLRRRIFEERYGVTFGSDNDMTSDDDDYAAHGRSWSDEDMWAASKYDAAEHGYWGW